MVTFIAIIRFSSPAERHHHAAINFAIIIISPRHAACCRFATVITMMPLSLLLPCAAVSPPFAFDISPLFHLIRRHRIRRHKISSADYLTPCSAIYAAALILISPLYDTVTLLSPHTLLAFDFFSLLRYFMRHCHILPRHCRCRECHAC